MYFALCTILFVALAFFTVLEWQKPRKWLAITEACLCGAGVLAQPVLLFVLRGFLSTYREAFASWAWDCVTTYLRYALPTLLVCGGLICLSALSAKWEKRYATIGWRRVRSLCGLACTVLLFAIAGFFGATSTTTELPLSGYIYAMGLADALILRGAYVIEVTTR